MIDQVMDKLSQGIGLGARSATARPAIQRNLLDARAQPGNTTADRHSRQAKRCAGMTAGEGLRVAS
jgi:hypothetical protein